MAARPVGGGIGRAVLRAVRSLVTGRSAAPQESRPSRTPRQDRTRQDRTRQDRTRQDRTRQDRTSAAGYPGDFTGPVKIEYHPDPDGDADPGEVVWGWVPFEEDHSRGKDRPVLVIGRDGGWLLGLMLTSKDHDRDAVQEARDGRHWLDVGTGAWDAQRRPSEVRLDRVVRLAPTAVRREGAALDPRRFAAVAEHARALNGWG